MNWANRPGGLAFAPLPSPLPLPPPNRAIEAAPRAFARHPLSSPGSELGPPGSRAGCACVTLGRRSRSPIAHRLLVMK